MAEDNSQSDNSLLRELEALRHKNQALEAAVIQGKRREEEFAETQSLLLAAIERSPAGIVVAKAPDGAVLAANRAMLTGLQVADEELDGANVQSQRMNWKMLHSDGTQWKTEDMPLPRAILRGETCESVEGILRTGDGEDRWLLGFAAPVYDEEGEIIAGVGVFPDITERKRAEEQLRESEKRLQSILDNSSVVVFLKDVAGCYITVNRRYEELFHVTRQAVIGKSDYDLFPQEHADRFRQHDLLALEKGGPVEVEEIVPHDDGLHTYVSVKFPLPSADGKPYAVCGIATDITERKRAEEQLRESEKRLQSILDNSSVVMFLKDVAGRYITVNRRYEELFHVTRQAVIGKSDYDLFPQEHADRFRQHDLLALEKGGPVEVEEIVPHDDGLHTYVSVKFPLPSADGKPYAVCGIATDITEHKRAEEERNILQLQLAEAQKMESIGRLAGGVAHDFNNLLAVINGYSALALDRTQPGDPSFDDFTEILRAGERAADLVRQLLAYSRKQVLKPGVLSLNATVSDMEKMLQRLLGEDIEIVVRLDPAVAPILADRHQIEQVIMNLAINARDAMPEGGTLTLETRQRHLGGVCGTCQGQISPGAYVELTVRDTGMGMDEHTLGHEFEPFFTTKGAGRGTGLGLSTVQGIVMQSGGHVGVESEMGKGSAFHIYLPVAERPTVEPSPLPLPDAKGGAETILLVEDQEEVRRTLVAILENYGYRVVETGDAEQGLRACASQPVDLLVTDVVMPKMSGVELARRARLTLPGLRTLFISGYSEDAHERKWESQAGAKFIQKPFAPDALAAKVREVLEGR